MVMRFILHGSFLPPTTFIRQDNLSNEKNTFISEDAKFILWFTRKNAWALADNPNRRKVLIRSDSSMPEETYPHQISRWSERHQHDWIFNSEIRVEAITEPVRVSKISYEETAQPNLNRKRSAEDVDRKNLDLSHHAASASNICALDKKKSRVSTN